MSNVNMYCNAREIPSFFNYDKTIINDFHRFAEKADVIMLSISLTAIM